MALCLILVLSVGDWHLLAILLGHRVAHLSGHLPLNLVLYSMAFLLRIMLTLFPWNILTVLLGYILTMFLWHLVTHFLGLVVTLCDWDYSSYSHLYIMALGYWYWTTDWLQNFITFFLIFIVPVWNLDSVTLLFVDIL